MSGLNVHHETGEDGSHRADDDKERRIPDPSLYVIVNIVMLCVLGVLVYGLVKIL